MTQFVFSLTVLILLITPLVSSENGAQAQTNKLKALIIDGENNHGAWPKTTMMMRDYLLETGLFTVEIARKAYTWQGPHNDNSIGKENRQLLLDKYPLPDGQKTTMVEEPKEDPNFRPDFTQYDVIISHLGWKATPWPAEVQRSLEAFVANGGGFVAVHAANNSFGDWEAYNKMIAVGGWGGRSKESGPYLYYNDAGQMIKDPSDGPCGSHGAQQEFAVTIRTPNHPITKGLPLVWMHAKDELYDRLRGPAENVTVLATAYSDPAGNSPPWNDNPGTGRHEPMMMAIDFGEGRVFHQVLGHTDYSMECVGFITTLQRGVEWAATGNVTQEIPADFPTEDLSSSRSWDK